MILKDHTFYEKDQIFSINIQSLQHLKVIMSTIVGVLTIKTMEDMFMRMLTTCSSIKHLKKIHAQVTKYSLSQSNFLLSKMVDICYQFDQIEYATLLFRHVQEPNNYLYNAMIRAYTHKNMFGLTINVYQKMLMECVFPDSYTYPFVTRSCGGMLCVGLGKQVHCNICKLDLKCNGVVQNSLLDMYVKCSEMDEACKLFEEMSERDVICWNSLISGYVKLGQVRRARGLFDEMPNKSIVSWTAMISGYCRIGSFRDALDVFRRMQVVGVQSDWITLVAVLPACAHLGDLELGIWIHFYAEKKGFLRRTSVCNALVEMYSKCGSVNEAMQFFSKMSKKDVISWSTMIAGLANHGRAREAIHLFEAMQRESVEPNEITFVGLLSACGHAGLSDEGMKFFDLMRFDHNISPGIEHYGCMVDLLGRTGRFDHALELIRTMPMKPDSAIWGSLLSSCRTFRNLDVAVVAMEHLMELEPDDMGNFVLLANIYADLGKWDDVSQMRKFMRSKSLKKTPGCSLIELDRVVHEFVSGDNSKKFSQDLYETLELLVSHQSKTIDLSELMAEDISSFVPQFETLQLGAPNNHAPAPRRCLTHIF